ncbi:MAG: MBL fold metallo-hydrolase [Bacteroidetes bacterium]|nr:MBL fold metallo-hydrolase [Bacteroidota bacterium]
MKIFPIIAENWKMDGGVAFGVVPQTIWRKLAEPDENNLIKITTRCLLVEDEGRVILFDTGMGRKQSEKYYGYRHLFGEENLADSLKKQGYGTGDITDVVFTHLHDDHCGGAVAKDADGKYSLVFKKATHYCSEDQWSWAMHPNKREIGSYFKENLIPIEQSGKLQLLKNEGALSETVSFRLFNGHTQGLIVPLIRFREKTIVFMADFIPASSHIPIPFVASVDIQPLVALKEKESFLKEAADKGYYLVFEHDYDTECCTVTHTEKGVVIDIVMKLHELSN